MSRYVLSVSLLAVALSCRVALGQVQATAGDSDGTPVKWETNCVPQGCLLQTSVLRGDSGDPPDPTDFHEYVGIDIAFERATRKPAYFAFHVDPNAQREQGISIAFAKGKNIDSDGTSRLEVSDCDETSCFARVPLGLVKKGKDSRNLNLLDKFQKADYLVLLYTRGRKQYRTMAPLSSFQTECRRVLTELGGSGTDRK